MKLYTVPEASEKLGIQHGRLREWISRQYIFPHKRAKGRGTKNLLSVWNLYQIRLFEYLMERGLSREKIGLLIFHITVPVEDYKYIDNYEGNPDVEPESCKLSDFILIYNDGEEVRYGGSFNYGKVELDMQDDMKDVIIINMNQIRKDVDSLLK